MNNEMRKVIQTLVREEARKWVSQHRELIRDVVQESVISEIQTAIREGLVREIQRLGREGATERQAGIPGERMGSGPLPGAEEAYPALQDPPAASTPAVVPEEQSREDQREGLYVYGVVSGNDGVSLGPIGLKDHEVFTVAWEDLAAVVHRCAARPYESSDEEEVKTWVSAHQRVVDAAWEWFGNVVPVGFDTIIPGRDAEDVVERARTWLKDDQERLKEKLQRLHGMAEYGIQVFWDPEAVARTKARESPEIQKLEKEIQSKPRGAAYLYRQKLERALKAEMERLAQNFFQTFHDRIRPRVTALKVEKNKPAHEPGTQMLMNLSCLVPRQSHQDLGTELEQMNSMEGFSVRFTGPWPGYSFV